MIENQNLGHYFCNLTIKQRIIGFYADITRFNTFFDRPV